MKKWLVVTGVSVAAIAAAGIYAADVFPGEIAPIAAADLPGPTDEQLIMGENLAKLGDCSACHTPVGSRDMIGGVGLPTPFGTIYATNITPDPDTGIGAWSYAAFERAMRDGVDREGRHLYPAFPYDHFAGMTDDDLMALYLYLMTLDPVPAGRTANDLGFPFSFRPLLAGWKVLFHDPQPWTPNPDFDEEENRGAYLAETVAHCGACHSPRNAFGAVMADNTFEGGEAEGWLVPPLAGASISPAAWDEDSYADYLFDGWSEFHGIAGGPMTPVVDHLYEADEDDVFAIAVWLARITPPLDEDARDAVVETISALDLPESFDGVVDAGAPADVLRGAEVFRASCLKCHKERISESQPVSLGLTYSVNAPKPTNLFNAIRHGIEPGLGSTSRKMQPVSLPPADMAAVAAFVRWQFTDLPAWTDLDAQAAAAAEAAH